MFFNRNPEELEAQMTRYEERLSKDSTIYVGIDVHKRSWHVTVRTYDVELWKGSIVGAWEGLEKVLGRYEGYRIEAVYEAGFSGFWLYDRIVAWGAECIVTPPSLILSDYGNRVKTDKLDSSKLAFHLSRRLLKRVWVPDVEARGHRQVIRRRRQLVGDRVRLQCRIKSELSCFGIEVPERRGRWSETFVASLWRLRIGDRWQTESFQRLLMEYQEVNGLIAAQTLLLKELSLTERYCKPVELLCSVPGIGLITAMEFLLEIGDVTRFANGRKLAAYVGLTPSQYSSGDKIRLGSITRIGKSHLRAGLIEVSWLLIRRDEGMAARYRQFKSRCGARRAIVAIARKLLLCLRRMLLDRCAYQQLIAA